MCRASQDGAGGWFTSCFPWGRAWVSCPAEIIQGALLIWGRAPALPALAAGSGRAPSHAPAAVTRPPPRRGLRPGAAVPGLLEHPGGGGSGRAIPQSHPLLSLSPAHGDLGAVPLFLHLCALAWLQGATGAPVGAYPRGTSPPWQGRKGFVHPSPWPTCGRSAGAACLRCFLPSW